MISLTSFTKCKMLKQRKVGHYVTMFLFSGKCMLCFKTLQRIKWLPKVYKYFSTRLNVPSQKCGRSDLIISRSDLQNILGQGSLPFSFVDCTHVAAEAILAGQGCSSSSYMTGWVCSGPTGWVGVLGSFYGGLVVCSCSGHLFSTAFAGQFFFPLSSRSN